MSKKTTIKKKATKKQEHKVSKERQFLMTLIKYTDRYIRNDGTDLDEAFKKQSDKLKKQLETTP